MVIYASCGYIGCALLTKNGNIYTGICIDTNCALGNCAKYVAIVEMLKNNERKIDKIVAYSAKDKFMIHVVDVES